MEEEWIGGETEVEMYCENKKEKNKLKLERDLGE